MKPWKKLLLGLAGIFALTSLAACSSSTNTLDKVKNKGTLTIALNPHFAPFEFKTIQDGKDTIAGADIEIAKAIGDELGVKVKFSEMSFDNVLASVQSGKADIAISGISATKERQKIFDFSDTYYDSETVLLVKKDATEKTYKQISDFSKKSIAVQKGSIQENIAKANLLYGELDRNKMFKATVPNPEDRSRMNVTFVMTEGYEAFEKEFDAFSESKGMIGLKGHRSVGGFRASIYNAMPIEGVQALVDAMKEFEKQNA